MKTFSCFKIIDKPLKALLLVIAISCFFIPTTSICQKDLNIEKSPFVIGETISFHSDILNEERVVNIYLPTYYELDSNKVYPVIYLLDGSKDEDFVHVAGLVQFATFPWIEMMPESIVVGIANIDRKRDFTFPTKVEQDKKDFPTTGHSEKFIDFIENELQYLITSTYRCKEQKTIIGQSLGGLLATEILFEKPHMFDNYIIVSPSLWWNNGSMFKNMPEELADNKSIFIAVGKEGDIMEGDAMKLHKMLNDYDNKTTDINFKYFEELDHGDTLHLALYEALKKIYQKKDDYED